MNNQDKLRKYLSELEPLRDDVAKLLTAMEEVKNIKNEEEREYKKILLVAIYDTYYEPRYQAMKENRERRLREEEHSRSLFWNDLFDLTDAEYIDDPKEIIKTWYPKSALFYKGKGVNRFNKLREPINERLRETRDDPTEINEDWENIVLSNVLQAFDEMSLDKFSPENNPATPIGSVRDEKKSGVYHELINRMKENVERDLLNGSRIDDKETTSVDLKDDLSISEKRRIASSTAYREEQKAIEQIAIDEIKKQLNEKELQLFQYWYEGYSDRETAERMGVEPATIRQRKRRLREKIRTMTE